MGTFYPHDGSNLLEGAEKMRERVRVKSAAAATRLARN